MEVPVEGPGLVQWLGCVRPSCCLGGAGSGSDAERSICAVSNDLPTV